MATADSKREKTPTLRGLITRLHFSSPSFCAGKIRPSGEYRDVSFAGKCYVREGDSVTLRGKWDDHPKFGQQFQVESLVYDQDLDVEGLAAWLYQNGDARGIGPVKAKQIAQEYGKDFGTILRENPEQMAVFAGVSLENIQHLAAAWTEREERYRVAIKLAAWGLTYHQADLLAQKFGGSAVAILEADPYLLLREVPGLGFHAVDTIALKIGIPKSHPGRLKAGIIQALRTFLDEGSTCEERERVLGEAGRILIMDGLDGDKLIEAALCELITEGKAVRSICVESRTFLALAGPYRHEELIAKTLGERNGENPYFPGETAAVLARTHCEGLFDESQERAVAMALRNRVSVITGGAGSGKTTVIKRLVEAYKSVGVSASSGRPVITDDEDEDEHYDPFDEEDAGLPDRKYGVALCAPTGKAARRLEEVVGIEATTIHRLLDYHPKLGFRRDEKSTIAADVVIVDEASMMDSELAYNLFRAIASRTALVLVGDHNQLPPVGPGALLRDCIKHELCPLTILGKCHRQAGTLKNNCNGILGGYVAPTAPRGDAIYSPWIVQDQLEKPEDVLRCVERLFTEIIGAKYKFALPWDVQFMSPIHKGPLGVAAMNVMLQRLYQKSLGVNVPPCDPEKRPKILVGDKVIQTKNNYVLRIMNGHQGEVLHTDPELIVKFEGRAVAIPRDSRGEIELAYCLTPHKMQGSEVPVAVVIAHKLHSFMLHRNWLYTAATRARQLLIVIGDSWGVRRAAEKVVANDRRTLLGLMTAVK